MSRYSHKIYIFFLIFLLIISSCISSCALFSPVKSPAVTTYLLSDYQEKLFSASAYSKNLSQTSGHKILLISKITAVPWLESSKMAYQLQPNQINYFALNQWAGSPDELLLPIVVQGLQSCSIYQGVISVPFRGQYTERLDIHILDFEQDFTQKPSQYVMRLQVSLVNNANQNIIQTRLFDLHQVADSETPAGGVRAADALIHQFIIALNKFLHACQNT